MSVKCNREKLIEFITARGWLYDATLDWWETPTGDLYHINQQGLLIPLSEKVPT